ncbi:uncharacterized protein [Dendrobates tinctorius]|uniref:uncharacterized protein isoform X1 n=1 Tax=Dendrobates tinctorius TaxID=92724 RepID=UPI003CC9C80B
MARLLLVLVTVSLALSGLVTAEDPIPVNGQLGSDLLLPLVEACTSKHRYRFDLLRGTQKIGAYDNHLQGLRSYNDRLTYDKETCTITLKELRTQDGSRFTAKLSYDINDRSTLHDINYQVTFIDPTTSSPSTPAMNHTREDRTSRNGTQVSHDGVRRFISFCLSLDSVVNVALGLLLLILQGSRYKVDDRRVNVAWRINYVITALTEICSISIMLSGKNKWRCNISLISVTMCFILEIFFLVNLDFILVASSSCVPNIL